MRTVGEIKMMFVVVPRGKAEAIIEHFRKNKVYFNLTLLGRGTAPTQWSDLLGLGDSKKDILIAMVRGEQAAEALADLGTVFRLNEPGRGIAFTVNVTSIGSKRFLEYCRAAIEERLKERKDT